MGSLSHENLAWTADALELLEMVPHGPLRKLTRWRVEEMARQTGQSTVTVDLVEAKYRRWAEGSGKATSDLTWTRDATRRIERIPDVVRGMVIAGVELYAKSLKIDEIDSAFVDESIRMWAATGRFHDPPAPDGHVADHVATKRADRAPEASRHTGSGARSPNAIDAEKSLDDLEHRPRIVSWNITAACHLRCPHCYLDARRRRPQELSTAEGLGLIDQMADAGTQLLILTGGEPLLREDLPSLARHATDRGIRVVLGTTGMQIDLAKAKLLKESGVLAAGISIDSLIPARHDEFRGMPGAWQKAVDGIDACRAEGLDVLIHTTAMKMNQDEIPALIDFAREKSARAFHLFFLVCTGRGERMTDLTSQEYERLLALILDKQEAYPGMMVRARCAPYIGRMAAQRGLPLSWSAGCIAGTSYCRVTPSGFVTPCPYMPTTAGNVREQSFGDIWETSNVLGQFRSPDMSLKGKCGECYFSRGDNPACIGCRARALALEGDALAADPWCAHEPSQDDFARSSNQEHAREDSEATSIPWTPEATVRLGRVPVFMRSRVRTAAETYARSKGLDEVTPEVLSDLRARALGDGDKSSASMPAS